MNSKFQNIKAMDQYRLQTTYTTPLHNTYTATDTSLNKVQTDIRS